MIYIELIFNLSLLVALSVVSGFIEQRWPRSGRSGPWLQGLLFGGAAVIGMLNPLVLGPGLIFDGRTVMVSVAALCYGPITGVVAALLPMALRLEMGGAGVIMGVLTLLAALTIGLLAHYRIRKEPRCSLSVRTLYLLGLVVHLAMLTLTITLPAELIIPTLKKIALPVILLYPLATVLVGKILADREALRSSEDNYRRLFEDHIAVKMILDPESGAILDANQAATQFYGWPREELKKMRIEQINTLTPAEVALALEKARSSQRDHFEFKHRRADGSIRDVAVFSSKVLLEGREVLHSIIHDITEQKRLAAEQEQLKAKLMEGRHLEMVGRLAGGIAHEFNNMMTVVLTGVELAKQEVPADSPVRRELMEIGRAGSRAANLTRQLLAFARQQPIAPSRQDLNRLIAGYLPELEKLPGPDHELQWQPGRELWPVKVDPGQIHQLLQTLVTNGREALTGASSGRVILQTANCTLTPQFCADHPWLPPGDYLRLTVSDNGRGMDQETQRRLFEPFFSPKEQFDPTAGLGLAVAYGIVKQNQGYIDVESSPGQGTSFIIYLPASREESVR